MKIFGCRRAGGRHQRDGPAGLGRQNSNGSCCASTCSECRTIHRVARLRSRVKVDSDRGIVLWSAQRAVKRTTAKDALAFVWVVGRVWTVWVVAVALPLANARHQLPPPTTRCLQCSDAIYSVNWYEKWTPERNVIGHTLARASSEQAWETNGILEYKFLSKRAPCPVDCCIASRSHVALRLAISL
jgi:hypothetical protein